MSEHRLVSGSWSFASWLVVIAASLYACAAPSDEIAASRHAISQALAPETEPNNVHTSATPIGNDVVLRARLVPNGDVDLYSFDAHAGDRVFVATMATGSSSTTSSDTVIAVIESDGTTVLEEDDDNGWLSGDSSIAGLTIESDGTHFVRVSHYSGLGQTRPYDLHFRLQSASATAEVEPNDTSLTGMLLPSSGFVRGTVASSTDVDVYLFELDAGDTVFASLDVDPERDSVEWNGRLQFPAEPANLVVNDSPAAGPDSQALIHTVRGDGTYWIAVSGAGGSYQLNISVHRATSVTSNCTTYASNDAIGIADLGTSIATLFVPGHPRVADVDVDLTFAHAYATDLDVELVSPQGNAIGLFSDVGPGGPLQAQVTFDEQAAYPVSTSTTVFQNAILQPEPGNRLHWLNGIDGGGTWTLRIHDDAASDVGTLNAFALTICEAEPICSETESSVYREDFESDDGDFNLDGLADEWEHGTPTTTVIADCHSGTQCWKTDLDGSYDVNSDSTLLSPLIDLSAVDPGTPLTLSWAMKYQLDSANSDHAWIAVRLGDASRARQLWEHSDGVMTNGVGNPLVTVQAVAGWSVHTARIDEYAGERIELVAHLDANASVQLAGLAIDDVSITTCTTALADAGTDAAGPGDAGSDTGTSVDAGQDATVVFDAGGDATLSVDAGSDASTEIDAGSDAAIAIDAGSDASVPVDAGPDSAVTADAASDAATDEVDASSDASNTSDAATADAALADASMGNDDAGNEVDAGVIGGSGGESGNAGSGGSAGAGSGGTAGSSGTTGGAGGAAATSGGPPAAPRSEGCGCQVPGGPRPNTAGWPLLGLVAALMFRRLRRTRAA